MKIDGYQSYVILLRAALGSASPAGEFHQQPINKRSRREIGLSFKKCAKAGGAKFFLRGILPFQHAIGVEDTAVPGPE